MKNPFWKKVFIWGMSTILTPIAIAVIIVFTIIIGAMVEYLEKALTWINESFGYICAGGTLVFMIIVIRLSGFPEKILALFNKKETKGGK